MKILFLNLDFRFVYIYIHIRWLEISLKFVITLSKIFFYQFDILESNIHPLFINSTIKAYQGLKN